MRRHVAYSKGLRRYMYQELDRSRGLHPQSRKENDLVDQWRFVELLGLDCRLLHKCGLTGDASQSFFVTNRSRGDGLFL